MGKCIIYATLFSISVLLSCISNSNAVMYTTTSSGVHCKCLLAVDNSTSDKCDARVNVSTYAQSLDGFGLSVQYKDWQTFSRLKPTERDKLIKLLFSDTYDGAKLSLLRFPMRINNTYPRVNDVDSVSLDHSLITEAISTDSIHIMPYVKKILEVNKIAWIWMVPDLTDSYEVVVDKLKTNKQLKKSVFEFYSIFAYRYIKSFYDAGIKIKSASPKEKFNTLANSPDNVSLLREYIGKYFGPILRDVDCEVWLGTICKCCKWNIDTLLSDSLSSKYISGISFRSVDTVTLGSITRKYHNLKQIHNSEFLNASAASTYWLDKWALISYYFKNDGTGYVYNDVFEYTSCPDTVALYSSALVAIDTTTNTYKLSHKYYLLKHLSGYMRPGAKYIPVDQCNEDLMAFLNPDNSLIVVIANRTQAVRWPKIVVHNKIIRPSLAPRSISTIVFKKDNGFSMVN